MSARKSEGEGKITHFFLVYLCVEPLSTLIQSFSELAQWDESWLFLLLFLLILLLLPLTVKKSFTILALLFRLSSLSLSLAIRRSSWCENHSTTTVDGGRENRMKIHCCQFIDSSLLLPMRRQKSAKPARAFLREEKKVKLFFCVVLKLMRESHGEVSTHNSLKKTRKIGKSIHEQRWRLNRFDDSMRCVNDEEPWRVAWSEGGRHSGS